jgi:Flp pilus assembly protein TadD
MINLRGFFTSPPPQTLEAAKRISPPRRDITIVLAAFISLYFALQIASYTRKSATSDEPIHLTAGYAILTHGDHRIDATHPPFLRLWAALPLLAMDDVRIDLAPIEAHKPTAWYTEAYRFSHAFLYRDHDGDRLLYPARFMIVFWGALLGVLLFCWAYECFGFAPAAFVLGFYLIEPNLAGHASLVTTDAGLTCFYFGTIYFLWRTFRRYTALNMAGAALFFSLAVTSKFSAVLLAPIIVALLALATLWKKALGMRQAVSLGLIMAAAAYLAIWSVYGFRHSPGASSLWMWRAADFGLQQSLHGLGPLLSWIDDHRLLPNAYVQGFHLGIVTAQHLPSYLAGEVSPSGWWYYFPLAFMLKTPGPLIALLLWALLVCIRRRRQLSVFDGLVVLLPAVAYLIVSVLSQINIGLRHILPVYPLLLLTTGIAVRQAINAVRWRLTHLLTLGCAVAVWLFTFCNVYPNTLTFFNLITGGPERGSKYLSDSNLDWGQHLKSLKQWMDNQGVTRINLVYFGGADPGYYGIDHIDIPGTLSVARTKTFKPELPGYVAISSTALSGIAWGPRRRLLYKGFDDLDPVAVIGNTIKVYWLERWPDATLPPEEMTEPTLRHLESLGNRLMDHEWYDQALVYYKMYREHRPEHGHIHAYIGTAYARLNRTDKAVRSFERAVNCSPTQEQFRAMLGCMLLSQGNLDAAALHFQEWTRLSPDNAEAHYFYGVVLGGKGRQEDAINELSKALKLDPQNSLIREHLDQLRLQQSPGV